MRIARILSRLDLGGAARQALASDPRLAERGHTLRLFAGATGPADGDLEAELRALGVDVVVLSGLEPGALPWRSRPARRRLREALAAFHPDLVHTHDDPAARALGALAPDRGQRRSAVHLHSFHAPPGPRCVRHARGAGRWIAVSHAMAEELLAQGSTAEERVVVVPPGLDLRALLALDPRTPADEPGPLRRLCGTSADDFLVGVFGRFVPDAGQDLALETFELLAERHPELQLVLIGDGPERGRLERLVADLTQRCGERVHLVGPRADLTDVMADLDAVLFTGRRAGLPASLVAAAAAARPTVATPVGGVPELVAHERTGHLGADAGELALGLDALLDDRVEAARAGARARLRVAERHGARRLTDRLETLYTAAVEEGSCAS